MPKTCEKNKCIKRANYSFINTSVKFCNEHKEDGMIIKQKLCIKCNKKRPIFSKIGERSPIWCTDCKDVNSIDTVNKKCIKCNKKRASFSKENKTAVWCADCREEDTINTVSKKCIKCNKKRPSFNKKGEKIAIWCADCKEENSVDVVSKKCLECNKQPCFNFEGESPEYCLLHKKTGMINVKNKRCVECRLVFVDNRYDGYCVRCFVYLFPDKPVSRNYKIKENHIFEAVLDLLPEDIEIIRDRTVGGCSKRRPDLMIDLGSHWICAENDENSHKDYDDICENKRTMELYTDMGNRPMILIRFNCDKYSGGQSLFKTCRKTGISLIKSQKEFRERTTGFADLINRYIEADPPEKAVTAEYLYYD